MLRHRCRGLSQVLSLVVSAAYLTRPDQPAQPRLPLVCRGCLVSSRSAGVVASAYDSRLCRLPRWLITLLRLLRQSDWWILHSIRLWHCLVWPCVFLFWSSRVWRGLVCWVPDCCLHFWSAWSGLIMFYTLTTVVCCGGEPTATFIIMIDFVRSSIFIHPPEI